MSNYPPMGALSLLFLESSVNISVTQNLSIFLTRPFFYLMYE